MGRSKCASNPPAACDLRILFFDRLRVVPVKQAAGQNRQQYGITRRIFTGRTGAPLRSLNPNAVGNHHFMSRIKPGAHGNSHFSQALAPGGPVGAGVNRVDGQDQPISCTLSVSTVTTEPRTSLHIAACSAAPALAQSAEQKHAHSHAHLSDLATRRRVIITRPCIFSMQNHG